MREAAAMLLMPPVESTRDWEGRDSFEETEVDVNLDPSVVEGGILKVRYITGKASARVTWSKRKGSLVTGEVEDLSQNVSRDLKESVPDSPFKTRKPYGFKHHVFQLIMSMAMVTAVCGLVFGLLGLCIFLIGVALPFELI